MSRIDSQHGPLHGHMPAGTAAATKNAEETLKEAMADGKAAKAPPGPAAAAAHARDLVDHAAAATSTAPAQADETTIGEAANAVWDAMAASLKELSGKAGDINGEVAAFADAEFPLNPPSGNPPGLPYPGGEPANTARTYASMLRSKQVPPKEQVEKPITGLLDGMRKSGVKLSEGDINALVQWVLRESYIETSLELRDFAEKVKFFNEQKKSVREFLTKLRELRAGINCTAENAATTGLDGKPAEPPATTPSQTGGPQDGTGTQGPPPTTAPDGGAPFVTSAAQRRQAYPGAEALVAEFTAFQSDSGRTDLEDYLLSNPGAQERLIAAIPYMTVSELQNLMVAFGGDDLKVCNELSGLWGRMFGAMTDGQILALAGKTFEYNDGTNNTNPAFADAASKDLDQFAAAFTPALNQARARVEADQQKTYGNDYASAAADWKKSRQKAIDEAALENEEAARAEKGAADESVGQAIATLNANNPDGWITTADMLSLLEAAGDAGNLGTELRDIQAFVEQNRWRMTDGAVAAFEECKKLATVDKKSGMPFGGIDVSAKLLKAVTQKVRTLVEENRASDETRSNGEKPVRPDDVQTPPKDQDTPGPSDLDGTQQDDSVGIDPGIDLNKDDGSIDAVVVFDQPPFIRKDPDGKKLTTVAQLDDQIKALEEKLNTIGDDAQLANVDLQNQLQKQQQTLQMMSNISKMLHDTAMAVIRKIGG